MDLSLYLDHDWRPSLGCTEPAAVAWAAALAAEQARGAVQSVHLACDRRVYKNCHAAGIPRSGGKAGIEWAAALGALLPDASAGLESFGRLDGEVLAAAGRLLERRGVSVAVEEEHEELRIDCRVVRAGGTGRAVVAGNHTRVVLLERDGIPRSAPAGPGEADRGAELDTWLRALSLADCARLAETLAPADRERLRAGCELNLAVARHGLGLLPPAVVEASRGHLHQEVACLVNAGVQARMSGEERTVMTLAGSGNKGITVTVPLAAIAASKGIDAARRDAALLLACLVTSAATRRIGEVSTMCGAANAAGAGLAAGLVHLEGGGPDALSRAVDNVVGTVAGMVCDGAKVGCGLKTATAVDAALRAGALAAAGFGVPASNGIVGDGGTASLDNLGRLARRGMGPLESEILGIMQEKLG